MKNCNERSEHDDCYNEIALDISPKNRRLNDIVTHNFHNMTFYTKFFERILLKDELNLNLSRYKTAVLKDTKYMKEVYIFMMNAINIYWEQRIDDQNFPQILLEEEVFMDAVLNSYLYQRVGLTYDISDVLANSAMAALSSKTFAVTKSSSSSSSISSLSSEGLSNDSRIYDESIVNEERSEWIGNFNWEL